MKSLLVSCFIFAILLHNVPQAAAKPQKRIMGGSLASIGDFRYIVGFMRGGTVKFGGTLISSRVVLTAGHNLDGFFDQMENKSAYTAVVNVVDIKKAQAKNLYKIKSYVRSPSYKRYDASHDIGLIQLDRDVEGATTVDYSSYVYLEELSDCAITGWGFPDKDAKQTSQYLKKANVKVLTSMAKCQSAQQDYYKICIQGVDGNQCGGDSGGPVICKYADDGKRRQVGIQSSTINSGGECGLLTGYSVACNVPEHYEWISKQLVVLSR